MHWLLHRYYMDEHIVCSITSEPSQSCSRRVSSFKDSSTLLSNWELKLVSSQYFSSTNESLKDETRLLQLWDGSLVTLHCTHCVQPFIYIMYIIYIYIYIYICIYIYIIYIYIHIYINIYTENYAWRFGMAQNLVWFFGPKLCRYPQ